MCPSGLFLLPAGWNRGVMAGTQAAIFNQEEETVAVDGRAMRQREPGAA